MTESEHLGMKLNKDKCTLLTPQKKADVHFPDGEPVNTLDELIYLGAQLNKKNYPNKELKHRTKQAFTALNTLNVFWLY